jgi:hypothetical protein
MLDTVVTVTSKILSQTMTLIRSATVWADVVQVDPRSVASTYPFVRLRRILR